MTTLVSDDIVVNATTVRVTDDALIVDIDDGRSLSVPLAWYPRLSHATNAERADWHLIGGGQGIHWPGIEEDISIESLLAGKRSQERTASLERWLAARK